MGLRGYTSNWWVIITINDNGVETTATLVKGQPYYREAGVSHNVINNGKEKLVFIEIEIKAHPIW